jgi:pyruvate kinase
MDHEFPSSTRTGPGTALLEPVSPTMPPSPASLMAAVERLRADALALEHERAAEFERAAPHAREGVRNLLHYLAVRRHDLRPLQRELGRLGLSSLGRMESRVMATLDAVARALGALAGRRTAAIEPDDRFELGERRLAAHAEQVFGIEPAARSTRVMVTLPTEAAGGPALIHELVEAGADLVRVNAAHDDVAAWTKMIGLPDFLRSRRTEAANRCARARACGLEAAP